MDDEVPDLLEPCLYTYTRDPTKELENLRLLIRRYKIEDADVNPEYL